MEVERDVACRGPVTGGVQSVIVIMMLVMPERLKMGRWGRKGKIQSWQYLAYMWTLSQVSILNCFLS